VRYDWFVRTVTSKVTEATLGANIEIFSLSAKQNHDKFKSYTLKIPQIIALICFLMVYSVFYGV